jgi:hypothetical protein
MVQSIPEWLCWCDKLCTLRSKHLWSGSGSRMPVILLQGWSVECVDLMHMSLLKALMIRFPAETGASVEAVGLLKSSVHVHCMCVNKIFSKHYMLCYGGDFYRTLQCPLYLQKTSSGCPGSSFWLS